MNLAKKKSLASRALKVSKNRIVFLNSRLDEIKEAITKQDIKDLYNNGAILIREPKGRKTTTKRKYRRGPGKILKRVFKRKEEYVTLTRKFRKYVAELRKQGKISKEELVDLRKKIKNRYFKNMSGLKDYLGGRK
ncbi:MAG: 50S ribosomal protein L19e [archaeon]|nr:50S ribosomal protein L19e [archaeon]